MIKGCDVSHWNGTVDFAKLKADGNQFVFAKATDGVGGTDVQFARNRQQAHANGLLFGAYEFFHANEDIDLQVKRFLQVVGPQKGELPPVLDWETPAPTVSKAVQLQRVLQYLGEIEKICGVQPILYSSPGWLAAYGDLAELAKYPLWIAHYGVNHPRIPAPFKTFTFWQYSASGGLDKDYFNGSIEQLLKFTGSENAA